MTTKTKIQTQRYYEALGGRKTAHARARISEGASGMLVNGAEYTSYFKTAKQRAAILAPFKELNIAERFNASVMVHGGGINAQAEAARNALAKAIVKFDESFRKRLRHFGYMTRDARMVERKKYGHKKARRAPQWKKR